RQKTGLTLSTNNPTGTGNWTVQGAKGMYVAQVEKNSPAQRADLQPGYLVIDVDGEPVVDLRAVGSVFADKSKGDRVRLNVAAQRQLGGGFVQYRQGILELQVR